jgi:enoyl-CoA hydratase/carnithine racemase
MTGPRLARTEIVDGIATLTMNRPEQRNALSRELIRHLSGELDSIEADAAIRALILAGAGKAFCAGMDIKGVMADAAGMREMLRGLADVMRRIRRLAVPTIARVQGAAVGGGCGLMVVTDFAITHPEARVGYPEVTLGLCPAVVAPWLIRRVGAGPARAILLAGGTMTGSRAAELGLATHAVPLDDLERNARELAGELASGGPRATTTTKRWLNELDGSLEDALLDKGAELSADVIAGDEAQDRLRAQFGTRRS